METNVVGLKMRGTIIKVPGSTPGLLLAGGQQKSFVLENVWRSPIAPAANMTVEIFTDISGVVTAVTVVEGQQLARERLEQFSGAAQEHGKEAASRAREGVRAMAGRMGKATAIAMVLFWIVWFGLPAVTFNNPMFQKSMTFWDLLGWDLRTASVSHGIFSLLGMVAIAVPFAVPFLRDRRARYLYAAPLACTVIALIEIRSEFRQTFGAVQDMLGSAASSEMSRMVSIGAGIYLLVILGAFLATRALRGRLPKN